MELLQGTLHLFILKALSWGPRHGYEISRWIRTTSAEPLNIEEGALYPALHRLEERRLVESEWGLTKEGRRAKYYQLTRAGRDQLRRLTSDWNRYTAMAARILTADKGSS